MNTILITKNNNEAIYIGRPSILKNPFPTKPSKFSTLTYSHSESMKMFLKYITNKYKTDLEFNKYLNDLMEIDNLSFSCFCIHKKFTLIDFKNFNINNVICHGEIISYFLFKISYSNTSN